MVPNSKMSKKSKKSKKKQEDEVEVVSNSELKEEPEDKEDKFEDKQDKTHELHFFNYEDLTLEEATRLYNILKPPFPAKNCNETATEFKGTEDDTEDEDEDDTEEKLEDKEKIEDKQDKTQELQFFNTEEESVKVCMEAVDAGNLPLVDSSPTTAIKVIAGGYDAKADMEAEDAGGDIEILGKGGG